MRVWCVFVLAGERCPCVSTEGRPSGLLVLFVCSSPHVQMLSDRYCFAIAKNTKYKCSAHCKSQVGNYIVCLSPAQQCFKVFSKDMPSVLHVERQAQYKPSAAHSHVHSVQMAFQIAGQKLILFHTLSSCT